MNSFYSKQELTSIGFKKIGNNVLISKKCSIYSPEKMIIGSNVRIDDFCILSGHITLHSFIHIGAYSGLFGKSGIEIFNFSGISPRCTLFSETDNFNGDFLISPTTKTEHNNLIKGKIVVKEYSQICADVVVLPGVIIEEGCIIGAKSLVKSSTKPWGIYFGQTTKRVNERTKNLLSFIKYYKV